MIRRLFGRAAATVGTVLEEGAPETTVVLPTAPDPGEAGVALRAFGTALLDAGGATNDIRETMKELAHVFGIEDVRVVVFPTVVFVQVPAEAGNRTEIESVSAEGLRLDQAGALERLVQDTKAGEVTPARALERLAEIRAAPRPYGSVVTVIGHTVLTLGFGLSVNPTVGALPWYLGLGAIVGVMVVYTRRRNLAATVLPVTASFTVTVLVGLFAGSAVGAEPFLLLAPPLVSFLPGLTMTVAAVELTSDEVVAGASRILYGVAQLALLGFGVYAAFALVGEIQPVGSPDRLGDWAPWLGVLLTAVGYVLFSSVPAAAFLWLLAGLYVTVAAQHLGNVVLDPKLSGFVGALVIVPFTAIASRWRSAPPGVVLLIPAFWVLVPGALGFIGVSQAASETFQGGEALLDTALAVLSIALGILVGTAVTRNIAAFQRTWHEVA